MSKKTVALIILDGFGYSETSKSNAIEAANNPDAHRKTYEAFNYITRYPAAWPGTFAILEKD